MARLKAEYSAVLRSALDSDKLASVSMEADWLFGKLLLCVDANGRYWSDPGTIAAKALTKRLLSGHITAPKVAEWLDELQAAGLIDRYEAEGDKVLEVVNFFRPKAWAAGAKFPARTGAYQPVPAGTDVYRPVPNEIEPVPPGDTEAEEEAEEEQTTSSSNAREAQDDDDVELTPHRLPDYIPEHLVEQWTQVLDGVRYMEPLYGKLRNGHWRLAVQLGIFQVCPAPGGDTEIARQRHFLEMRDAKVADKVRTWLFATAKAAKTKAKPMPWLVKALESGPHPERGFLPHFGHDDLVEPTAQGVAS